DISIDEYLPKIEEQFLDHNIQNVNIIFVDPIFIRELNTQYRNINDVTDVLSFNVDATDLLGEIYICPEYIKSTCQEIAFKEEILRLIIHGILHLIGYDHEVELTEETKNTEKMFVKQEQILENVL
ncbi:MAG: putative rRNA maturation factor, partial [candidate division WS6 bacterium GW2011_GWC2_36_7]